MTSATLTDLLFDHKPDMGGGHGGAGFDYQRDWALCLLLELTGKSKQFLMLFDYHDDIVVLEPCVEPHKRADFFQVKKRDPNPWTVGALIQVPPRAKPKAKARAVAAPRATPVIISSAPPAGKSILGKLYANACKFDGHSVHLCFVSNQPLTSKLADGSGAHEHQIVSFRQLSKADQAKIRRKLRAELNLAAPPALEDVLHFRVAELSAKDSLRHTAGVLNDYLDRTFPNHRVSPTAVYDKILKEIRLRHTSTWRQPDFSGVRRHKGLSSDDFSEMLFRAAHQKDSFRWWSEISADLQQEQFPVGVRLQLHKAWDRYAAGRINTLNPLLERLRTAAAAFVLDFIEERKTFRRYRDLIDEGRPLLEADLSALKVALALNDATLLPNPDQIDVAILYEYRYEYERRQLEEAYSKFAQGTP